MRVTWVAGLLLLVIGGFVLVHGISYRSHKAVMNIGELHASVEEKREVPRWLGAVAVAGGLALVLAGSRRRR